MGANTEATAELQRTLTLLSAQKEELAGAFDKVNAQKQDPEQQLDEAKSPTARPSRPF